MEKLSRRDLLKGMGIAGGATLLAGLGGCVNATNYPSQYTQNFYPALDNTYDIGSALLRYANIYSVNIHATDVNATHAHLTDLYATNAYVTNLVLAGTITQVLTVYLDTATVDSTTSIAVCNKITAFTLTLPAATGSARTIQIKNIGAGVVTVEGNLAETIDDELNQHINQYEGISIVDYAAGKWAIY
jgi:hypothetical protein